jgi:DNA-binding NarL/FixJ family response regulator
MTILVVDDHVLIRVALCEILKELKRDAVIGEAANCRQTMRFIEEHPDLELILLDLTLPDGGGLNFVAELRKRYPAVGIAVLSAFNDPITVTEALKLGAVGFIPKSAERAVLQIALQLIFSGGVYVPPEILAQNAGLLADLSMRPVAVQFSPAQPHDFGLTDRQIDVLALMKKGYGNKAISRLLNLAEPTVKNHVSAVLRALKVGTRLEAVAAVDELGWQLKQPRLS